MSLLQVKNLSVEFATDEGIYRAVDNLSFDIPEGKTIGLVGESGSGKSVTSLAIMGLLSYPGKISQGEILFQNKNLVTLSDHERRLLRGSQMSMIFQEPMTSLNPVITVGDQIIETLMLHKKVSRKVAYEQAIDLLHQVQLPAPKLKIKSYPHELSGGQKQRVMIAMSIACGPKLLICDEPTTALDVTIQKQILELLRNLQQQFKMSMLFITHDLGVISEIADDLVVMYRSKMCEKGNTNHIMKNPTHPYTRGLLACRPHLGKNPKRLLTVSDFMNDQGVALEVESSKLQVASKVKKESSSNPLLKIEDLQIDYQLKGSIFSAKKEKFTAVNKVSLSIDAGSTLGLVGESGCGKTTLGRAVVKLVEATSGKILFKDRDITKLSKAEFFSERKNIQMIFQDPYSSLNPRMSIMEILREPLDLHEPTLSNQEVKDRINYFVERVGLSRNHLNRYPHEFSGGQRQRISIARALVVKPTLVICDECVSALDVSVQAQVLNLLLDLQSELNLTYLFISHDLSVVHFMSDNVAVMNQGKIVEYSFADELYANPKAEYTRNLLSAIPKLV
jgi:peptide/nickel transport system ATP-binding protein